MLVRKQDFDDVLAKIISQPVIGADTETFGLEFRDDLFSIILHTGCEGFYFNFNSEADNNGVLPDSDTVLSVEHRQRIAEAVFTTNKVIFFHNAPFDLVRMLRHTTLSTYDVNSKIFCTRSNERLIRNDKVAKGYYSLEETGRRYGIQKNSAVEDYIKKHKLYSKVKRKGKKTPETLKHFDKVPLDLLVPYGVRDAFCAREIGIKQLKYFQQSNTDPVLIFMSRKLNLSLAESQMQGIHTDPIFIENAIEYERQSLVENKYNFKAQFGMDFVDGSVVMSKVFNRLGLPVTTTEKGNPSFTDDVLSMYNEPALDVIKAIRANIKRFGTYFTSYQYYADMSPNGLIHPTIDPDGARTGRCASQRPNIQNIPKRKEDASTEYRVRGCFVPSPDYVFGMIDYDQQEYRLMLDYAGEMALIKKILDDGLDVHTATAEMVGVDRARAKTINFGILYGQGKKALAAALGITEVEAGDVINLFYSRVPRVKNLIDRIRHTAGTRGYLRTWSGRILYYDRNTAYKAPNGLIQGGCADVTKFAMVKCYEFLKGKRSRLLVPIHDEIIFEIHKDEIEMMEDLRKIMTNIYKPKNGLYLTCGGDIGEKNLAEKISYGEYLQGQQELHLQAKSVA